jgi:hypothetical protein
MKAWEELFLDLGPVEAHRHPPRPLLDVYREGVRPRLCAFERMALSVGRRLRWV